MSRFLNEKYRALSEYTPGEQPRDKKYIKLNTNESPFAPSPSVVAAVSADEVRDLRLYSDPECTALKAALAARYDVEKENVYLANGSDDILNFAFMAFADKGVCYPEISYGFYSVFAALHGITAEEIPLKSDFSIDHRDYCGKNKLIVIANPNAPTGIFMPLCEIEEILKSNPDNVVLVDEAYVDFGGTSALSLLKTYENLLVVRTFSKSRSMAGARLGFAFASREIIADLERLKYSTNPYNINRLTQAAGVAALAQDDYYAENCKKIIKNREYTENELKKLGFTLTSSLANFVFAKSDKISGEHLYLKLKEKGVLVRHFSRADISEYNRITVGSIDEMRAFVNAVKQILEEDV